MEDIYIGFDRRQNNERKQEQKEYGNTYIYIIAILFFVSAALSFLSGASYGTMFLLFGVIMLTLGVATTLKVKKEAEENMENEN